MPDLKIAPNLTIHYLEANPQGSPPVLLLHGLGVTGSSWQLQIPALVNAGYRVLAPDGRGFGASSYPGGSLSVAKMAMDFAVLLQDLGAVPAHVVGISMGGAQALQLTLDYPHFVKHLVLVNTFATLRSSGIRIWLFFVTRYFLTQFVGLPAQARIVARRLFPNPDQEALRQEMISQVLQANPNGYRAAMRALARFNTVKRLGEIHAPTLVITGALDSTISLNNQRVLAQGIPGARQLTILNAGHAVIADQPSTFNQHLLAFLGEG